MDVDHAQVVRQLALSGAHEEQPFVTQICSKAAMSGCRWRQVTEGTDKRGIKSKFRSHRSPGGRQDGGVESSEAGERHGQGDGPVHDAKHLVCKRLGERRQSGVTVR